MELSEQKAILVTGASTGIGEACALKLDGMGFRVFAGIRREADGEALRQKSSGRLVPIFLDVTSPQAIAAAAGHIAQATGAGGLYGLVNNAGIAVSAPVEFLPIEKLRQQLEVNVVGQVAVIQTCLPMLRQARGRIVNISSISGRFASPFLSPYAASKHAFEAISDALRVELGPWGIRVIVIEPGNIATPIWSKSLAQADELLAGLPPQAFDLYGEVIQRLRGKAMRNAKTGLPVEIVAGVVVQALIAGRPKARYLVGPGLRLVLLIDALAPTWFRDKIIEKRIGRGDSNSTDGD